MNNIFSLQKNTINKLSVNSIIADRGLQYGDGFFTTMLIIDNKIINWSAHWQRLNYASNQFGFCIESELTIKHMLIDAFKKCTEEFNVAKLIITRGCGGKGYQPLLKPQANYYLYLSNSTQASIKLRQVGLAKIKWAIQPLLAGIKHLNRLENVMAQQDMLHTDYDECVMLNTDNDVISGTSSSIYLIENNTIITPKITTAGINSTSLCLISALLKKQGRTVLFKKIDLNRLKKADEIFFCNSVKGIMPVEKLFGKKANNSKSIKLAEQFINFQDTLSRLNS